MAVDSQGCYIFDTDPVDAPPVLFHTMRAPCACGRSLAECSYTFFPSAVFVHGVCQECGPQTAIFAPHMRGQQEPVGIAIARRLAKLTVELARTYGEDPQAIVNEFLNYLTTPEHEAKAS